MNFRKKSQGLIGIWEIPFVESQKVPLGTQFLFWDNNQKLLCYSWTQYVGDSEIRCF